VLDSKGVIFWSYCSPMATRGSPRSRILRASSWPSPTICSARLLSVGEEARRGEGSLIEGVEATRRLLTLAFERFRVRPIEALGKRFDPTLHEAVAMEESAEASGTVVGVVEDGYTINGRLLRPARVVQKPGRMPRRPRSRRNRRGRRRLTSGRRDDRLSAHPQNAA
jgi:GrpE